MATLSNHPIRAVLKAPETVADFIIPAQAIHDAMATNATTLVAPVPTLAVLAKGAKVNER